MDRDRRLAEMINSSNRIGDKGYRYIYSPGHHRSNTNGYVREHIIAAEIILGRPLKKTEVIHHTDDKTYNGPGGFVICQDQAYHNLLHKRKRALLACGDARKVCCHICGEYDFLENMMVYPRHNTYFHRFCNKEKSRKRRADKKAQGIKYWENWNVKR